MDKNGGTISVHSEGENKGSVFSFTMKMKRHEEDALLRVIEADEEQSSYDWGSGSSVSNSDGDDQDGDVTEVVALTNRVD